ncbi:hypothetical protein ACQ46_gp159 [Citrobacter phage Moon]|uniref:Uncharacterized protein n=1 Tax=Citrobacter phage Moon TaxID=1540095 RepID=A0A0A0YVU7_9CAUD|nr:hypothetical protein ACQ46_gp159 [Citrobacter phage Moon]AIX12265.1 hypothetical protein CPT_Moon294 [Citrobacter phage Moon]
MKIKASEVKNGNIVEGCEVVDVEIYPCGTKICITTESYDSDCGEFEHFPMEFGVNELIEIEGE